jgi:YHS domain-containing protein
MPIDVVCDMQVGEDIPFKVEYEGKTYYFCSQGCAEEFEENPEAYVLSTEETFEE